MSLKVTFTMFRTTERLTILESIGSGVGIAKVATKKAEGVILGME